MQKDEQTYAVIGAAMEVHRELGYGFLEAVYQEALVVEFENQKVQFQRELPIDVIYKGVKLNTSYRPDFICHGSIIVEIKAMTAIGKSEFAQVINYLKATGLKKALLLNFAPSRLEYKRIVLTKT
ncbi:MAG: GxxExxY protein [Elusimicrobiales bacterium]|nr:GxxExxY protein [Elusimicrobiales bacterium]